MNNEALIEIEREYGDIELMSILEALILKDGDLDSLCFLSITTIIH